MQESLVTQEYKPEDILNAVHYNKGILWDKIAAFREQISVLDEAATHDLGKPQEDLMKERYPLKHHFAGGLYTREIFMPQGHVCVSFIHKQDHPSFLLEGKVSFLNDEGMVETIEAPHSIFTQIGAQRVFYIHEDVVWTCVHKTNKTNVRDAELELFSNDFKDLPKSIIDKRKKICQQQQQPLLQE